jgi:hypothetical protein
VDEHEDTHTFTQMICMPYIQYFDSTAREAALDWLYEDGFSPQAVKNCSVLAVTNEDVDKWNDTIQKRNTSQETPTVLESKDILADVDDPYGYLQACLPPCVLNDFTNPNKAPPHLLHLKVSLSSSFFSLTTHTSCPTCF